MSKKQTPKNKQYYLDSKGRFVIEDYNHSKVFSNFFPGIAGLWGIPMWAFYVNRGQCIASFGIESKDKAIMEFQPANKSYRLTSLQGFRTFIKVTNGKKVTYWEPFQNHLPGTDFKKSQRMYISAHDLTIEEENSDLGITARVNYFTLPDEPYSALIRKLTLINTKKRTVKVEVIDGLPAILPYGLKDGLLKNISRTVEAWLKITNLENKAPYYRLNVEVADTSQVTHIKEGNFYFSYHKNGGKNEILTPIVEVGNVFGTSCDFLAPEAFLSKTFKVRSDQQTTNRTPCAMSHSTMTLNAGEEHQVVSIIGYTHSEESLNRIVQSVIHDGFVEAKCKRNEQIIAKIKNFALTKSSSEEFDLYAGHTFLDNILRGGLPISLKTSDGHVAFNVYSRKHGDLERDYNFFYVAPTFYTQGNGNYRDVNQNRRNDVWFNEHVRDNHLIGFLNLSQADGYNPLVIKGTSFAIKDHGALNKLLKQSFSEDEAKKVKKFLLSNFQPGEVLEFIAKNEISLKCDQRKFLSRVLENGSKQEVAEHGEGYWSDHWTYNLDMIESYLSVYPEDLRNLLLESKAFTFYHNDHYVLPRDQRYVVTQQGVRQYGSVKHDKAVNVKQSEHKLRGMQGEGAVYQTHLVCKLLCLIANKAASLDPSGIGIEMESDKPNWYDALNGLPGLLGSAISETFELKRLSKFLLETLKQLSLDENKHIEIFEELATFIEGLTNLLSLNEEPNVYWNKSNDVKERYRQRIRLGIEGQEKSMTVGEVKNFLELVIAKTTKSEELARNDQGFLVTYFYHEVINYVQADTKKGTAENVIPKEFKLHKLPLFLEGYVHALRTEDNKKNLKALYQDVRKSNLYDKKLKMYKVNQDLCGESEEIGRTRIFPPGWLENESIWLHMEYKFILELIRTGLHDEFYENFKNVLVPFLKPEVYGRSILENSSFIVSSAHQDELLHGQGFVARLSGSTAEFMHIWLLMNLGANPFTINVRGELNFNLNPVLAEWLFTKKKSKISLVDQSYKVDIPKNAYAFLLFGKTLVVYHNPKRKATYGDHKATIRSIELTYPDGKKPIVIKSKSLGEPYSQDIRDRRVARIDVIFE